MILRLYESKGTACCETLHIDFPVSQIRETNYIEQDEGKLEIADNSLALEFTPFQVRTIRILPC